MQTQTIKQIPLTQIVEPKESVRTQIALEGIEDLAASIRDVGIINPLHVRKADNDTYEIVAGHRRYLASKMAGLIDISCVVLAEHESNDLVKLHENYFREEVSPVDEGEWFMKLREQKGWTVKEVAACCKRSESYISARMLLVQGDQRVLAALQGGHINFSQAKEILVVKDDNTRFEVLRLSIESGATVNVIRRLRQEYEQRIPGTVSVSNTPAPETSNIAPAKYLLECPACTNKFPVEEIYPLSVCKDCHRGLLAGFAEANKEPPAGG